MPNQPKISACLIVKNEDKNIYKCLNSIKGVVGEIILVDTGSTDNTIAEIDRFMGDADVSVKLFYKEWNDHFADMRNYSLEQATGDYILVIDGDETLEQWQEITNEYDYYVCKSVVAENGNDKIGDTIRIFRNSPDIRYSKAARHATVDRCLKDRNGIKVNVMFRHPDLSKAELDAKLKHNLNIHLKALETEPDNPTSNYHISNCYMYFKDWDKAIEYGEKALQDDINIVTKAVKCVQLFLAYFQIGVLRKDYLLVSLSLIPNQIMSRIELARIYKREGQQAEAMGLIETAEAFNNNYLTGGNYTDFPNERYYTKQEFQTFKQEII